MGVDLQPKHVKRSGTEHHDQCPTRTTNCHRTPTNWYNEAAALTVRRVIGGWSSGRASDGPLWCLDAARGKEDPTSTTPGTPTNRCPVIGMPRGDCCRKAAL